MSKKYLAPAVYTPMPAYMADPRMAWARFADGDGAGGPNGATPKPGEGGGDGDGTKPKEGEGSGQDDKLGEGGLKALQAERDARKAAEKLATEQAARIKELEDAGKSEDQKRTERLDALEKSDLEKASTIASKDALLLRYEIAAEKGIDLKAAARLQGTTREEIAADADEFKKLLTPGRSGGGTQFHREREASGGQGGGTSSLQAGRDAFAARHNLTK
jgi:hypothetical protein